MLNKVLNKELKELIKILEQLSEFSADIDLIIGELINCLKSGKKY